MSKRHGGVLFLTICLSLLGQATISSAAQAEEKKLCEDWAAKVASVQGKVEAKRTISDNWEAVKRDNTYCPGDQIRVGKKSRASIVFTNETIVRLDQYSALTITEIKKEGLSFLELIEGIAHFISRVPRSLKVKTPFVNAAIEGTEFVVEVNDNDTTVTVFEGTVLTQNDRGEVRITNNESARAEQDKAPEKILIAKPRDAVQWALYFPPVIKADADGNDLQQASDLLYNGRADEAEKLLAGNDSAEAKALKSIIAIVNNNKDDAFKLANDAVQQSPDSAAAHIALSYAWQSKLDLNQALDSANTAITKEADNAIAWARLAELQLSTGQLNDALASSKKANELYSSIARSRTILGYAYLTRIDTDKARKTFNEAIELNQVDPLPRLGLGLAKIRDNELKEGRREIEIAASLDPNNAIIRSYLGKAYFEEKRGPLDAEQFAMAKELDPNDPTPYFYDAIRKQTENDPVGALKDLNKSIELNDNRAVYRSSLQLDQDEAARNASLARVYQDLGFEQAAVNEATRSLANDPSNHSAHRLLADAYSNRQRHETAHASELFQAKMLQPLGLTFLQPQSIESDLNINSHANNFGNSASDFSNLYNRSGSAASFNLFTGNQNTMGDELQVATLSNNFAISAAQYTYQSDGFRPNNDSKHDIYTLFLQSQVSNNLSIQMEYFHRNTDKGDLELLFDPNDFTANERNEIENDNSRVGFNYQLNPGNILLGSYIYQDLEDQTQTRTDGGLIITTITDLIERINRSGELQYILSSDGFNLTTGLSYTNTSSDYVRFTRTQIPLLMTDTTEVNQTTVFDSLHYLFYSYAHWDIYQSLELDLGFSYDNYEAVEFENTEIDRVNPKFGLRIKPWSNTEIRLASLQTVNRPNVSAQTLEPTQVTGFNQYFADYTGSKITQHNIAFDIKATQDLQFGFTSSYRDIDAPRFNASDLTFDDLKELEHQLYINWIINRFASLYLAAIYEGFENTNNVILSTPKRLKTILYPLNLAIKLPSGFSFNLVPTYVDHDYVDSSLNENHDSFVVTDLSMGYKFPDRNGSLSLGVHNLFDEQFNYYNLDYVGDDDNLRFIPSRSFIFQLNITLQ